MLLTGSWCRRNESFPVQPHLPVWDGLNAFHYRASGRYLNLGKVMGMLYPGPVGKHNLVSPLLS